MAQTKEKENTVPAARAKQTAAAAELTAAAAVVLRADVW